MANLRMNDDLNIVAESPLVIEKLGDDLNIIQKLDDEPNDVGGMTSTELKETFDRSGNLIKAFINDKLIPAVLASDATEAARAAAETAREQAEAARAAAETAREQAEAARKTAETAREQAETAREEHETVRVRQEQERVAAEQARDEAEKARVDSTTGIVAQATTQADAAKDAAQGAARDAEAAARDARTAAADAQSAAQDAGAASASAESAAKSEQAAQNASAASQSWAAGGTGTRPDEETNNAKYWAGVAEKAAGGGVTSFNGRAGVVAPQKGDYTAEMVGAVPTSEKGKPNGVATLDQAGKVPEAQLPERLSKAITMERLYRPFPYISGAWEFAYGGGRFVAVNASTVWHSTDGLSWERGSGLPAGGYHGGCVTYGNGAFFVLDSSGKKLYRSIDGARWSLLAENVPIERLLHCGGPVILGDEANSSSSAKVFCSEDGTTWNRTDVPRGVRIAAYGGGKYIAVKSMRGGRIQYWHSSDGKNWTASNITYPAQYTNSSVYAITFGNGKFVAVGSGPSAVTTDGVSWEFESSVSLPETHCVFFKDGKFYGTTYSDLYVSETGLDWTKKSALPFKQPFTAIADTGRALIYGHNQNANSPMVSEDLENWLRSEDPPPITYPNGEDITDYLRATGIARLVIGRTGTGQTSFSIAVPFLPSVIFGTDSSTSFFAVRNFNNGFCGWCPSKSQYVSGYYGHGLIHIAGDSAEFIANTANDLCLYYIFA